MILDWILLLWILLGYTVIDAARNKQHQLTVGSKKVSGSAEKVSNFWHKFTVYWLIGIVVMLVPYHYWLLVHSLYFLGHEAVVNMAQGNEAFCLGDLKNDPGSYQIRKIAIKMRWDERMLKAWVHIVYVIFAYGVLYLITNIQ